MDAGSADAGSAVDGDGAVVDGGESARDAGGFDGGGASVDGGLDGAARDGQAADAVVVGDTGSTDTGMRDTGSMGGGGDARVGVDAAGDAGLCASGATRICNTMCGSSGTSLCTGGVWGACAPPIEICNGADDDCDGSFDEGFACRAGASSSCVASCNMTGTQVCSPTCTPGVCMPPAEVCNGADDDCDGARDNGFACRVADVRACNTSCNSMGSQTCSGTCAWDTCTPPAETCNFADDDCDGQRDEGFRVSVATLSYTRDLAPRIAPCDGVQSRESPGCNAAIHRYCDAQPCSTTGFGPVENSGDVAIAACIVADVRQTTYTALNQVFPGACSAAQVSGLGCNAAISRYCSSIGLVTGYGPIENSGDVLFVACVPSGVVTTTSFTALRGYLSACDGVTRSGPACNAAIHRFCMAQGYASGFGPIENSADIAVVVCVPN